MPNTIDLRIEKHYFSGQLIYPMEGGKMLRKEQIEQQTNGYILAIVEKG